jgi:hypothetical protein
MRIHAKRNRGFASFEYMLLWFVIGAAVLGSFSYVLRSTHSFLGGLTAELNEARR